MCGGGGETGLLKPASAPPEPDARVPSGHRPGHMPSCLVIPAWSLELRSLVCARSPRTRLSCPQRSRGRTTSHDRCAPCAQHGLREPVAKQDTVFCAESGLGRDPLEGPLDLHSSSHQCSGFSGHVLHLEASNTFQKPGPTDRDGRALALTELTGRLPGQLNGVTSTSC